MTRSRKVTSLAAASGNLSSTALTPATEMHRPPLHRRCQRPDVNPVNGVAHHTQISGKSWYTKPQCVPSGIPCPASRMFAMRPARAPNCFRLYTGSVRMLATGDERCECFRPLRHVRDTFLGKQLLAAPSAGYWAQAARRRHCTQPLRGPGHAHGCLRVERIPGSAQNLVEIPELTDHGPNLAEPSSKCLERSPTEPPLCCARRVTQPCSAANAGRCSEGADGAGTPRGPTGGWNAVQLSNAA